MTADIFPHNLALTVQIENSGSMNSTRSRKIALVFSQQLRKRQQRFYVDPNCCRSNRWKILPDRFDAGLAADSATG